MPYSVKVENASSNLVTRPNHYRIGMKLTEIAQTKIKLDLTLIEDNVAWFENLETGMTFDFPVHYHRNDRTYEITNESETYWCFREDIGYHIVSKTDNKIMVLQVESTYEGFEIKEGHIYHIVKKH